MKLLSMCKKATKTNEFPHWKSKKIVIILTSLAILEMISLNIVFPQLAYYVTIRSTGNISIRQVVAKSGSPQDVQAAVNSIAAMGGGTVYVPEGEWTFNPPQQQWGCAVSVPGGVSVIGAGIGKTILKQTTASTLTTYFFALDGSNGKPIRISGFTFEVVSVEDDYGVVGITVDRTLDFRIDHISFINFSGMAIYTEDSRGVIDHCNIDNPYKDNYLPHNPNGEYFAVWGYGIVITAPNMPWQSSISYYLGQYKDYIVYIEDCNFSRCRHAVASNNEAWYVVRYCSFEKASAYGQVDVHGGSPGGRGHEVYNCVFDLSDESYSLGQDAATEPRGGGGIVWNNTVIINTNYPTKTVDMGSDGQSYPYDVRQYYIWGNTAYDHNQNPINFTDRIDPWNYQENVNYFLRAPNQQQDGFTYTPYPYPHPITQSVSP